MFTLINPISALLLTDLACVPQVTPRSQILSHSHGCEIKSGSDLRMRLWLLGLELRGMGKRG